MLGKLRNVVAGALVALGLLLAGEAHATSYTPCLRLNLPVPGDPAVANAWGTLLNFNASALDNTESTVALNVAGSSNVTLTANNGATDQTRYGAYYFDGALTGNITVFYPLSACQVFIAVNLTTGAHTLTLAVNNGSGSPAGNTVGVPQNHAVIAFSDGTNITLAVDPGGIGGAAAGANHDITSLSALTSISSNFNMSGTVTTPSGNLEILGSTSGQVQLEAVAVAGSSGAIFPNNVGNVAETNFANQTWTNPQLFLGGAFNLFEQSGGHNGFTVFRGGSPAGGAYGVTLTFQAVNDTVAVLGQPDQGMSGGVLLTSNNNGTGSGTFTPDCGKGPSQYITNNGAFTFAAPANDSNCLMLVTNGASAGTITFSGYTVGSNTGSPLDTVNGHHFMLFLARTNGLSTYSVYATQ